MQEKNAAGCPKVNFETISFLNCDGDLDKTCPVKISNETLLHGYRTMAIARHIDERMLTLQRQGTITFAMSAMGEEACSVASAAALDLADWMYPQYREAGIAFWRGLPIESYIHHMFGNGKDSILGRQMPNHFGCAELNIVQVSSPIGTKIPHAAGCAYAMKLQKEKTVAICYFGEGATSEGDFHAGVNFAAVRRAPAIFFCRNNGYAISTPVEQQFASDGIAPKGVGYGITAMRVDGNDFFAVFNAVQQAKILCLEGNGPVLIEAMTYRLGAHSSSDDPTCYRQNDEVEKNRLHCPILRLRRYLENQKLWDDKKEKALWKEISDLVTNAIEEAKKAPPPPLKSLFENVYFSMPQSLKEQYHTLNMFFPER